MGISVNVNKIFRHVIAHSFTNSTFGLLLRVKKEDTQDSISSTSPSVKIQIMGGKVALKKNPMFTTLEGDGIESKLPFTIFSTLPRCSQ